MLIFCLGIHYPCRNKLDIFNPCCYDFANGRGWGPSCFCGVGGSGTPPESVRIWIRRLQGSGLLDFDLLALGASTHAKALPANHETPPSLNSKSVRAVGPECLSLSSFFGKVPGESVD